MNNSFFIFSGFYCFFILFYFLIFFLFIFFLFIFFFLIGSDGPSYICERLPLKNQHRIFRRKVSFLTFQYPKFYNDGMVLSCNMFCQGFFVIVEKL